VLTFPEQQIDNVLGMERDVPDVCDLVHRITKGRGHVVVDGVAAAPHLLSSKAINATKIGGQGTPEWYIVSLHKCFGPHFGCLLVGPYPLARRMEGYDRGWGDGGVISSGESLVAAMRRCWEVHAGKFDAGRAGIDAINTIFITIRQMQVEYFSSSTFHVRCWFLFPFVC
jgi:selenocysteine lyase/cysteine desulfurase